ALPEPAPFEATKVVRPQGGHGAARAARLRKIRRQELTRAYQVPVFQRLLGQIYIRGVQVPAKGFAVSSDDAPLGSGVAGTARRDQPESPNDRKHRRPDGGRAQRTAPIGGLLSP